MSQQIIFSNGTALDVAVINGQSVYHQGAQRDSLEIQFFKDTTSFDALDALTSDTANTDRLTIVTQDGDLQEQAVYEHYVLRTELKLKSVVLTPAKENAPTVTEDRLCVTLAQLTHTDEDDHA